MQQVGVGGNLRQIWLQLQLRRDSKLIAGCELCLKKPHHAMHDIVERDRLEFRLRHPGEVAEARNNIFQVLYFCQQGRGALSEDFLEHFRAVLACAEQILDRYLEWE